MNRISNIIRLFFCIAASSLLVSCNQVGLFQATQTPTSTPTIIPSSTATNTPIPPTFTPTSTPTLTPTPTFTPTPNGSGSGLILFRKSEKSSQSQRTIDNIYLTNVLGQSPRNLTNNDDIDISFGFESWSPDGKKILYGRSQNVGSVGFYYNSYWKSELFIMDIDGKNIQKISPAPQYKGTVDVSDLIVDTQPSWSPDGKSIVFISNRHALTGRVDLEVYQMDLATYKITQLTNANGESYIPSYSPDGKQIAFMSNRTGNWEIFVMNADGTGLVQMTKNSFSDRFPRWSPDGKKLIYHSDRDGNIELYTMVVGTKEETRITNNPANDETASWSPDGKWIAFQSDREGNYEIYLMSVDGSKIMNISNDASAEDMLAEWSPQ